jgi:hypothetical protein
MQALVSKFAFLLTNALNAARRTDFPALPLWSKKQGGLRALAKV